MKLEPKILMYYIEKSAKHLKLNKTPELDGIYSEIIDRTK